VLGRLELEEAEGGDEVVATLVSMPTPFFAPGPGKHSANGGVVSIAPTWAGLIWSGGSE
jgi:hypothetical protein